ncbi:DUF4760 domain-containing protein [Litorimonas sp. RW-G-Af-16]|uniref:DUF4760 domain-containing protein n=1 Tax=Litorimonas sp. RW-G-Af-16 TaxID=3241168 RepID=UPI00390CD7AF
MEFFGKFDWPKVVELFPVYIAAIGSLALLGATFWQVMTARKDASNRAAFQYYTDLSNSAEYAKLRKDVASFCRGDEDAALLFDNPASNSVKISTINDFIDHRENLAIAILNGGVSEEYSKLILKSLFLKEWENLETYIKRLRNEVGDQSVGGAIQKLAERWQSLPQKNAEVS